MCLCLIRDDSCISIENESGVCIGILIIWYIFIVWNLGLNWIKVVVD